jgi:DMSO/TMAO reductase YedYZ molybdopterin-dependent catalytic subunit
VLHVGGIPAVEAACWRLRLHGAVAEERTLTLAEVRSLPVVEQRSDFHCVTKFSVLDNDWRGVAAAAVLDLVEVHPAATHVMVEALEGYTANLPLAVLRDPEALLVWQRNGEDLTAEHGWPLRLIVPSRYAWKSVKWISGLELLVGDRRGFWEERGYHNDADPFAEQRYSYQE